MSEEKKEIDKTEVDKTELENSNQEAAVSDGSVENTENTKKDPVARFTRNILIACVFFFIWHLVSDRYTPITEQARVRGYVIPISAQVAGNIVKVNVNGNKIVKEGDILFEIDPENYKLAVDQAKAALEQAGQQVGATTAAVAVAKAELIRTKADLATKQADAERIFAVETRGVIPQADVDRARGLLEQAKAAVVTAEASYLQAREQLGEEGEDNAAIEAALSSLAVAQLNLSRTKVRAPADGGVSNARLNIGEYAAPGVPLMSFVTAGFVWVEADFRENSLGHIEPGNTVDIVLDSAPGTVYQGEVVSVAYGVKFDQSKAGELATPVGATGWLREPQRFPVVIRFNDNSARGFWREGGQADIIIYTSDSWLLNSLGKVWIYMMSIFSYAY